jgi:hypothetical protein
MAGLKNYTHQQLRDWVCDDAGWNSREIMAAIGIRASDNLLRRTVLISRGAIIRNQQVFYPIWDWNKDRLLNEINKNNIKLPDDYLLFGRSFDGFHYGYLKVIKDQRPDDWKKILEWMPLAEAELWLYERGLN